MKVLAVLTPHGRERVLEDGYLGPYSLDPGKARACEVLVVVQTHIKPGDRRSAGHHQAFLAAHIVDIQPAVGTEDAVRDRWIVRFKAPVDVAIDEFWTGSTNPVRYTTTADLTEELLTALRETRISGQPKLTAVVDQARRDIATAAGVEPDAVFITIKV